METNELDFQEMNDMVTRYTTTRDINELASLWSQMTGEDMEQSLKQAEKMLNY